MRSWILPVLAAMVAAAITAGLAAGSRLDGGNNGHENDGRGNDTYAIGLWGDLPYSDAQAQVGVPNLITDMNARIWRSPRTMATSRPEQHGESAT